MDKGTENLVAAAKMHDAARIAHEVNRAFCQAMNDDSQVPWADAPAWQKQSAINGVIFHVKNPDATPAASHEAWLAEKTAQGWTWGPVKDLEKLTHPCCLPFEELPIDQKAKDYLFRAVVHAVLEF